MGKELKTDYVAIYKEELSNIDKFEKTVDIIKGQAICALKEVLNDKYIKHTQQSKQCLVNSVGALENIADGSLRDNLKVIYSQMCILAVSSLEAILKIYFENSLIDFNNINKSNEDLKKTRVSLLELIENNLKFSGQLGSLILEKNNLDFQDLKSIKRIFNDYLSKQIVLDLETEKKICFFLESRHVLVHKGGIVDEKFINSTKVLDANIKNYKKGNRVEIDSDDWQKIKENFLLLVKEITKRTKTKPIIE